MLKSEAMQHQYWVTKKSVQRKLGGKEDECIVSSDAELDAKIELFKTIHESSVHLHRVIDAYQERLCVLAQEENALGRFLKETGKGSATCGKVMGTTGKSLSYCGQQRIAMRAPLLRLLQEVDTFRSRAIIDTHLTIQAMERERTEYRAALSWMKSASSQLDPDTGRGLDKFRKAQQHVRASKAKFDRYTLDCLQKIDLLAAARCNMFSHALVAYQAGVMEMFVKTNGTFAATIAALDKEPHYSFTVLKELTQGEEGAVADGEKTSKSEAKKTLANTDDANQTDKDHMLFFKDDYKDDQQDEPKQPSSSSDLLPATLNLMDQIVESAVASKASSTALDGDLLGLAIANDGDEFGEFVSAAGQPILPYMPSQLLMDDMLVDLGNWTNAPDGKDEEPQQSKQPAQLQPLADGENKSKSSAIMDLFGRGAKKSQSNSSVKASAGSKGAIGGKANWMDLFAELDPLANPDLMEKKLSGQHTNNQAA